MNYQGDINIVGGMGGGGIVTGVALLPNTGNVSLLQYVAIAAIVTGAILIGLQAVVVVCRRFNA